MLLHFAKTSAISSDPIVPGLWEKEEAAKPGSTYFVAYNQLFKNPAKVTRNGSHER
jgi:hypothetical protein